MSYTTLKSMADLTLDKRSSFCVLPWKHLFVSELGHTYPCCIAPESNVPNFFEGNSIAGIDSGRSVSDLLNTSYMKNIRKAMLEGSRPEACSRCYALEDLGLESHRLGSNKFFKVSLEEIKSSTELTGQIDPDLLSLDLRLGNNCNLSCRMCSPFSSKNLISEWSDLDPEKASLYSTLKNIDWFKKTNFLKIFESHPKIQKVHFAGGEPLIIAEHYTLLEEMVRLGYSKNVTLTYNTNLNFLPSKAFELWKNFNSVSVMASVDGYGALNEYIRFHSSWDKLTSNISKLCEIKKFSQSEIRISDLSVNVTVQIYNVFSLPQLLSYLITLAPEFCLPILSPVMHPRHYNIQALPEPLKLLAEKGLLRFLESLGSGDLPNIDRESLVRFKDSVRGVINHMRADDLSVEMPEFIRQTKFLDSSRGQSVSRVCPELSSYF